MPTHCTANGGMFATTMPLSRARWSGRGSPHRRELRRHLLLLAAIRLGGVDEPIHKDRDGCGIEASSASRGGTALAANSRRPRSSRFEPSAFPRCRIACLSIIATQPSSPRPASKWRRRPDPHLRPRALREWSSGRRPPPPASISRHTRTCSATPAATRSPTRATTPGRSRGGNRFGNPHARRHIRHPAITAGIGTGTTD
jgi:hypothetical protein